MLKTLAILMIQSSMGCYVGCVCCRVSRRRARLADWLWVAGAALCVIHVVLAMAAFHGFNHAAAVEHTARVTKDTIGLDWGGGVYVNYLFTIVWCWDAAGKFRTTKPATPLWVHLFISFIVFNATAIFGPPHWKWLTCLVGVVLGISAWRSGPKP